jgi:hypothetical protein
MYSLVKAKGETGCGGYHRQNPGTGTHFKVGHGFPEGTSYGQHRQRLGFDDFDIVADHAETVAHVHDGASDTFAFVSLEHQTGAGAGVTDTRKCTSNLGFRVVMAVLISSMWGLKDGAFFSVEVEGVVFQEGTATWQALAHHPHGADKGGRFPVTFAPKP